MGSLVVVRPLDPSDVRVGMAIVFVPDDDRLLVTHRVVKVVDGPSGLSFRTQGDASATADPQPVPARAVRGRAAWAVPKLGRLVRWLAWPRGFLVLVVLPALVLGISEARARGATRRNAAAPPDAQSANPGVTG